MKDTYSFIGSRNNKLSRFLHNIMSLPFLAKRPVQSHPVYFKTFLIKNYNRKVG